MFSERSYDPELMDDFNADKHVIKLTLAELEFINKWLGGNNVTISGIDTLINQYYKTSQNKTIIKCVDIGCGGGDILKILAQWARKKKYNFSFTGIDANNFIIEYASKNTTQFSEIFYENLDVFSEKFQNQTYDIITTTLFCHHFTNEQLIMLFSSWKKNSKIGIVINDIHRHWFAYYSIKWLTELFSNSYMVKYDSKLSVLRAFKRIELENILQKAGIKNYKISWHWAFRWQIIIFNF